MMQNNNMGMNVLRCPVCSGSLTIQENRLNTAFCGYCNKVYSFRQKPDGSIVFNGQRQHNRSQHHRSHGKSLGVGLAVIAAVFAVVVLFWIVAKNDHGGDSAQETRSKSHQKSLDKVNTETYEWPDNALGEAVPEAVFEHGRMFSNTSERFMVDIGSVSKEEFEAYIKECVSAGFNINSENSANYLHAFNEEGYELQVSYTPEDQMMSIYADAPKLMSGYEWPKNGVATLLPQPEVEYGVVQAGEDSLEAEFYHVSAKQFENYVDECIKAGFDHDYDKATRTGYFKGYDANGYELYITYEENDYYKTMEVTLR